MQITYINEAGSFEGIVMKPQAGWFGEAGDKKAPYIRFAVQISEGPKKGQVGIYHAWLTDAAFDKTVARLTEVFGWDGDLEALANGQFSFEGLPCNIETAMETYNNKQRCKVAWLNRPGGGGAKPLDRAKVNSLLSKLSSRAKAMSKNAKTELEKNGVKVETPKRAAEVPTAPAQSAPGVAGATGPDDDDDVPF